jgi:hypothetical protein
MSPPVKRAELALALPARTARRAVPTHLGRDPPLDSILLRLLCLFAANDPCPSVVKIANPKSKILNLKFNRLGGASVPASRPHFRIADSELRIPDY